MFAYILNKARNIASTPVMRKVLKIRMLGSLAKNIQSRLYPLAYADIAKMRSKGPMEITVAGVTAVINFLNNASLFSYFDKSSNERIFLTYILEHTSHDFVFYDLGANIGIFTLFFAKHGKEVVAFEPFPNNCKVLLDNIKRNNLHNVRLHDIALSDRNGTAPLFFPDYADNDTSTSGLASLGKVTTPHDTASITVDLLTLDSAVEKYDLPLPNAIKIDIEGAEYTALIGMKETLKKSRADLFIEVHPEQIEALGASQQKLYNTLSEYGYKYEDIQALSRFSSGGKKIHAWHAS